MLTVLGRRQQREPVMVWFGATGLLRSVWECFITVEPAISALRNLPARRGFPPQAGQNSGPTGSVSAGAWRTPALPVLRALSCVGIEEVLEPGRWVSGAKEGAFRVVLNHAGSGAEQDVSRI